MSVTDAQPSRKEEGTARTLGVFIALFIAGPVVGSLVGAIPVAIAIAQGGTAGDLPQWVPLLSQVVTEGAFLAIAIGYMSRRLDGIDASMPEREDRKWIAIGLAGALAVWTVAFGVSEIFGVQSPTSIVVQVFDEVWALAAFVALGVTLIPAAEEALFRGMIQGRLRLSLGRWSAIGLGSVAFLSLHLLNFTSGTTAGLAVVLSTLFLVSMVFGYVYERTGNLLVSILVHSGYNGVLFVLFLAGVVR